MVRKLFFYLFLVALFTGLVSTSFALEKVKLSTTIKWDPVQYLPVLSAEEKGFWKQNGLDVEWVPFKGSVDQMRGVAAGAINIGLSPINGPLTAVDRGLAVIMVAQLVPSKPYILWVRSDSPYRHPQDLKGARIGVTTLGGTTHAFGRIMLRAHGVEKDVRFVGAGGVRQAVAGIKVGAFEALITPLSAIVKLKLDGTVRDIASNADYLPKPWIDYVIFSRKDYIRSKQDVVKVFLKAIFQSIHFVRKNPNWAIGKIKSFQRYSEEAAKLVYESAPLTTTGKLDRRAVENVRSVFIKYGLMTKDKAPAVDELFTNEYIP